MNKLITNYTFDASAKTITFNDYLAAGISIERILLVVNSTDGIFLFNLGDADLSGSVATNVLTVNYDTTSMSDTDKLYIKYDDPDEALLVNPQELKNTIDTVTAYDTTDGIQNGTALLTVKRAIITASASGNTSVVAAVSAKKIRVVGYSLSFAGAVNAKFQSSTTDISGLKYGIASTIINSGYNPKGWFETGVNTALNINLSDNIAVSGELLYVEIS